MEGREYWSSPTPAGAFPLQLCLFPSHLLTSNHWHAAHLSHPSLLQPPLPRQAELVPPLLHWVPLKEDPILLSSLLELHSKRVPLTICLFLDDLLIFAVNLWLVTLTAEQGTLGCSPTFLCVSELAVCWLRAGRNAWSRSQDLHSCNSQELDGSGVPWQHPKAQQSGMKQWEYVDSRRTSGGGVQ